MNLGSKTKITAEASMSSMTDLVFLMLIFFIILSTMISPGIPVNLPKAKSTDTSNKKSITVSVDATLQHFVNQKPIATDNLAQVIDEEMKNPDNNPSLLLQIDETVPTGVTVHILDIAKQHQWKVAIATKSE